MNEVIKVPQFIPSIGVEEYASIKTCFDTTWITEGPQTQKFQEALLEHIGVKYGVFAPNGTLALYLGLCAMGVGPGDEVLVPDFTFIASATAVEMTGATPIFVDVELEHFQIDMDSCKKAVTNKTKAIMPVHIYGMSADMTAVMEFADAHGLLIIEDAAQAIGVKWKNRSCGSFGAVGCFSFFADKTITTGEGGFVVTNDATIYDKLRYLRNQGRLHRGTFIHNRIGYNFRITDIQAAIGLTQLDKLDWICSRKYYFWEQYVERLAGLDLKVTTPPAHSSYVPFRVTFISDLLACDVMAHLAQDGIEARSFFYPLHKQPCFTCKSSEVFNSDHLYKYGVCLPAFPTMTDMQLELVCTSLKEFYA